MMQVYSTLNENITALPSALQEALSPLTIPNLKLTMLPIVLARRPREDDEEDLNENEDDLEDSDEEDPVAIGDDELSLEELGESEDDEDDDDDFDLDDDDLDDDDLWGDDDDDDDDD